MVGAGGAVHVMLILASNDVDGARSKPLSTRNPLRLFLYRTITTNNLPINYWLFVFQSIPEKEILASTWSNLRTGTRRKTKSLLGYIFGQGRYIFD